MPEVQIYSPWKDPDFLAQFRGRTDLLNYAKDHSIPVEATKDKPYSMDDNLMHISYESGILEDPKLAPSEEMFQKTVSPRVAPDRETKIEIHFKDGIPFKVVNNEDGTVKEKPLELFQYLNELGRENGIGRVDIVENRFVGIKSRGVYETPGGTILRTAHMDIEGIAMDREVLKLRDMLTPKISELIYNGFWFSPEMDFLMCAIDKSQEVVDGVVYLSLYKGNATVLGRESPSSLYNKELSSMDVEGGFNQQDSKGFINIHAIRLKAHHAILNKQGKWPMPFMKE
jgi:argininosuccinate synthase